MENSYRIALEAMLEWAKRNSMCIEDRISHTSWLVDHPEVEP